MKRALLALAALASACSGTAAPPKGQDKSPAPVAPWSSVAFTNKSWGRPVDSWQVNADGTGYWAETQREQGKPFGSYTVVYHDFRAGEAGVRQLALLMGEIPNPAPDPDQCEVYATDMNYGELTFAGGPASRTVKWNAGCRDAGYLAFLGQLMAADELVQQWGKGAPVAREEKFGEQER